MFKDTSLVFIGGGVMGEAMLRGILGKSLLSASQITVADPDSVRGEELAHRYGIRYIPDNAQAARDAHILALSVKPQVLPFVLPELRGNLDALQFVLSVVAGAKVATIARTLGERAIVRSIPNTPAQIGQGMTVWTATDAVSELHRRQAAALLSALGDEVYVDDEKSVDMATALNGSGPAYVFLVMEALIDAGVQMGFSRVIAKRIVLQTMLGSVEYAKGSDLHFAELRNQVTSPGGTTAAGLFELESGGLRTTLARGVLAAYKRSIELGQEDA